VLEGAPASTTHKAVGLYFYKVKEGVFVPITAEVFAKINAGTM